MNPVEVVKLTLLMAHTRGSPDLTVGLIDGPVAISHAGDRSRDTNLGRSIGRRGLERPW